jgi:hypothetical protein
MAYVANVSTGAMDLGVAIKGEGSFSTSDLEGTWHMYMFETDPAAGSSYHAHGTFTVDESGNITGGTYIPPGGQTINATGGAVSLDSSGILSGTLIAEGGITVTFTSGKIGADKNIMAYVANVSTGAMDLGVAIKGEGSFSTSDLEGTWHVYLMETNPVAGTYWLYGTFTVDESGNITGGTYNAPDGTSVNVTGGSISLDSSGVLLSGTVDVEGGLTGTFPSGKIGADKNFITFVGNDTNGSMDLGVAVKAGLPQPGEDDSGGSGGGGGGGGGCFISTMNK